MSRSPNLRAGTLEAVVSAIRRMSAPVCWDEVVASVKADTGYTYTRQALAKHAEVVGAYKERKHGKSLKVGELPPSPAAQAREKGIAKRDTEIDAMRTAMWRYEEMFILICNNAYALNISMERLLQPLTPPR